MRRCVSLFLVAAAMAGCTVGANPQATITTVQKAAAKVPATVLQGAVVAPNSLLGPGASVISVGGGNVISVGGGNVISVGGGNVISVGGGNFSGLADRTLLAESEATPETSASVAMTTTATITTASEGFAPVAGTLVAVYDLKHKLLKQIKSNDKGEFELKGLPKGKVLAMRTVFETGGKSYYLSTLFRLDKDKDKMPLDPLNTVIEATFFKFLEGKSEKATDISMALLQTLWTHANSLEITFDPAEIELVRTRDELVKVYEDKVVSRFPEGGEARATYQEFLDSLK